MSPDLGVADALRALSGPGADAVDGPSIRLPIGVPAPNPGRLREHDLHHVALGVRPNLRGEIAVSVLELLDGPPTALIGLLCVGAVAIGYLRWPLRTHALWARLRGGRTVYGRDVEPLYAGDVAALRRYLGVPAEGLDEFWGAP